MKVAILGGIPWHLIDVSTIVAEIVDMRKMFLDEFLPYTFDEFVEPTPYVGNYQSRHLRPVIWASALRQFYRR